MRRLRNVKIVATLGPASSDYAMIRALFEAGADVFRLNMSHGVHADIAARHPVGAGGLRQQPCARADRLPRCAR